MMQRNGVRKLKCTAHAQQQQSAQQQLREDLDCLPISYISLTAFSNFCHVRGSFSANHLSLTLSTASFLAVLSTVSCLRNCTSEELSRSSLVISFLNTGYLYWLS